MTYGVLTIKLIQFGPEDTSSHLAIYESVFLEFI